MLFYAVRYSEGESNTAYVEARLLPIYGGKEPDHSEIDEKINNLIKPFMVDLSHADGTLEEIRPHIAFSDYPHYVDKWGVSWFNLNKKLEPNPNPVLRTWKVRTYKIVGHGEQPFIEVKKAIEKFVFEETGAEYFQIDDLPPATRYDYSKV